MGRIGIEVARIALGLRMKVIAADTFVGKANIEVDFYNGQSINVDIITEPIEQILKEADIITLHVPAQKGFVIGKEQLDMMKDGVMLINCARGGVIDEEALIDALDSGKVRFAGLDVFENEPAPSDKILAHSKISLSPHIGAATLEAQDRIGEELAIGSTKFYRKYIQYKNTKGRKFSFGLLFKIKIYKPYRFPKPIRFI